MRIFLLTFISCAAVTALFAGPPAKNFPHPDQIRYDGQCLTIQGKPTFIFSGSFHYFRCPKPLWRDRFEKIKAAGCNAVETYVPWNYHEPNMPSSPDDFSQINLADFKDWLRMAHDEFGLYTIIRPGPYICAEWDDGGFPRWLMAKMPPDYSHAKDGKLAPDKVWLRSDEATFLTWSEHWMEAVCPTIAAEQITHKAPGHGGVILVQIENEYDLYKEVPEHERVPHLSVLYHAAISSGIEVPIFTCWTKACRDSSDPGLSQVFDAFNAYPRMKIDSTSKEIAKLQSEQPDAPVMISELQGGWFGKIGGLLSEDQPGLSAEQINAHTLLAIQGGATALNYYMLFGGTNFGTWGARDQTTSYDYDAPIREAGGVGDKYRAVAAIGAMLRVHGPALARAHELSCQAETGSADVTIAARRAQNGATYLFVRNHSLTEPRQGSAVVWLEKGGESRINYDLGPFGFKVLYVAPGMTDAAKGEWLPRPVAGPQRPSRLPDSVRASVAQMRTDPGAEDRISVGSARSVSETEAPKPPENTGGNGPLVVMSLPSGPLLPELGVYDARTVVYSADFSVSADQLGRVDTLQLKTYPGDGVVVEVNGHVAASGPKTEFSVGQWLRAGENSIRVLYIQGGLPNFGPGIQGEEGLSFGVLGYGHPDVVPVIPLDWRLARRLGGVISRWPELEAGSASGWTSVPLDTQRPVPRKSALAATPTGPTSSLATWYRVEFVLPALEKGVWVPWRALVDEAGDGQLYLNGHPLGRIWEVGPQREYYLPECWLRFGGGKKNVLTFCLSPMQRGVALRAVEISAYSDEAEIR